MRPTRLSVHGLAALAALALTLSGCARQSPAPAAEGGAVATPTAPPSPTPGESPAAAADGFRRWEVARVLAAFKRAGLEAEGVRGVDAGSAAAGFAEAAEFYVPSAGEGGRGWVLSFNSAERLEAAVQSYAAAGEFSWVFVRDNVVVRLDGRAPEGLARRYEAALTGME